MALWVFQIAFDVLLVVIGVLFILARREQRLLSHRLKIEIKGLEKDLAADHSRSSAQSSATQGEPLEPRFSRTLALPVTHESNDSAPATSAAASSSLSPANMAPLPSGSLVEKQNPRAASASSSGATATQHIKRNGSQSTYEAYEKADVLLAKGRSLAEIAMETGLSLAELQLLSKIGNRIQ